MTNDHDDLTDLLLAARDGTPPSDALMARVMADAARVQQDTLANVPKPAPVRGGFGTWLANIGGWRGAGGLVAATVTGLMVGVYAPDSIDAILGGQLADYGLVDTETLIPGWGELLAFDGG